MASLSILIITYNRPENTLELLKNIALQQDIERHVHEILLLNNASTVSYANVEGFVTAHSHLPIKYINHTENLGVARGRNFLIEMATAKYLLVLDDDVEFEDATAIQTAATLFDEERNITHNTAVITLNIFYHQTRQRQVSAFPHKNLEQHKNDDWFLTYYFTGAAHLMKRELFAKTGLYPVDFFYGMEEYDLSYRIIDAGYTLAFDNKIKVLHKESPEGRVTNSEKLGMMWRNKAKVAWRYLPKKYFYSTIFMWSLQFLKKSGFNINGFFKNYSSILSIPKKEKRSPIAEKSLQYLKRVGARLWY